MWGTRGIERRAHVNVKQHGQAMRYLRAEECKLNAAAVRIWKIGDEISQPGLEVVPRSPGKPDASVAKETPPDTFNAIPAALDAAREHA